MKDRPVDDKAYFNIDIVERLNNVSSAQDWDTIRFVIADAIHEIKQLRMDFAEAYDGCRYALAGSPGWESCCETVVWSYEDNNLEEKYQRHG